MKKVLTIAAVVALTASFTSCRKNYDCTYETTVAGTTTTTEAECLKCNKADVATMEDAGWVCM